MASLADILEQYRNWKGVQDWNLGRQEDRMLGHSEQARGLWDLLQGVGVGDVGVAGVLRSKPDPQQIVKAYKLFRLNEKRPGELFPLFVNANDSVPIGEWHDADIGPLTDAGKVKSKLGPLAFRPGWHAGDYPIATHIGEGGQPPIYRPYNQAWAEVDMPADID